MHAEKLLCCDLIVKHRFFFHFLHCNCCRYISCICFQLQRTPNNEALHCGYWCTFSTFFFPVAEVIKEKSSPELLLTASSPSYFFLNSRLHLVMASLPPVVMAGEQEVNQRSIISQPAPGGKGASHGTTPSLLGPLPAWEPLAPQYPAAASWAICSVLVCRCARSHL